MKDVRDLQKPSLLLDEKENSVLFDLIGNKCMTTATAVVQLYLSQKPDDSRWNQICTGVATFIKDNVNRSYYIRIYDLVNQTLVWQQELYNEFVYKESRQFFHTFESDTGVAGLNFADTEEAKEFKQTVVAKLEQRWERLGCKKMLNKSKMQENSTETLVSSKDGYYSQLSVGGSKTDLTSNKAVNNKRKGDLKKKKISKLDIGTPCSDFRVVSTIAVNGEKGFAMKNVNPDMKQLFNIVGVEPDLNKNKKTVDFIYKFVERNGGMGELKRQISKRHSRPNAAKTYSQNKQPSLSSDVKVRKKAPPIPAPPKTYGLRAASDEVHTSVVPPAPPPPPLSPLPLSPPPPPPVLQTGGSDTPSSPIANTQQTSLPINDDRAKLMESIRKFSRSEDCLVDGTTEYPNKPGLGYLRKVESNERIRRPSIDEDTGMIGALARALHDINMAVKDSDDEDADDESYDSWSD